MYEPIRASIVAGLKSHTLAHRWSVSSVPFPVVYAVVCPMPGIFQAHPSVSIVWKRARLTRPTRRRRPPPGGRPPMRRPGSAGDPGGGRDAGRDARAGPRSVPCARSSAWACDSMCSASRPARRPNSRSGPVRWRHAPVWVPRTHGGRPPRAHGPARGGYRGAGCGSAPSEARACRRFIMAPAALRCPADRMPCSAAAGADSNGCGHHARMPRAAGTHARACAPSACSIAKLQSRSMNSMMSVAGGGGRGIVANCAAILPAARSSHSSAPAAP